MKLDLSHILNIYAYKITTSKSWKNCENSMMLHIFHRIPLKFKNNSSFVYWKPFGSECLLHILTSRHIRKSWNLEAARCISLVQIKWQNKSNSIFPKIIPRNQRRKNWFSSSWQIRRKIDSDLCKVPRQPNKRFFYYSRFFFGEYNVDANLKFKTWKLSMNFEISNSMNCLTGKSTKTWRFFLEIV